MLASVLHALAEGAATAIRRKEIAKCLLAERVARASGCGCWGRRRRGRSWRCTSLSDTQQGIGVTCLQVLDHIQVCSVEQLLQDIRGSQAWIPPQNECSTTRDMWARHGGTAECGTASVRRVRC